MTTLTSALNYGALITLSCCNAVLQIAAAPACGDPAQDSNWLACVPDGTLGETDLRRKLLRPGTSKPQGERACLHDDPGDRSQPDCGAFQVLRGNLSAVETERRRKPVDRLEWRPH